MDLVFDQDSSELYKAALHDAERCPDLHKIDPGADRLGKAVLLDAFTIDDPDRPAFDVVDSDPMVSGVIDIHNGTCDGRIRPSLVRSGIAPDPRAGGAGHFIMGECKRIEIGISRSGAAVSRGRIVHVGIDVFLQAGLRRMALVGG